MSTLVLERSTAAGFTHADLRDFTPEYLQQVWRGRGYTYETIAHYRGASWILRTNDERTSILFTVHGESFIDSWIQERMAAGDTNAFEKYIDNKKKARKAA